MTAASALDLGAAAFLRVDRLQMESHEAQWQKGATPHPREDTTERSKGLVNDPTFTTFADTRRQKLRSAVLRAEASRSAFLRALEESADTLEAALAAD